MQTQVSVKLFANDMQFFMQTYFKNSIPWPQGKNSESSTQLTWKSQPPVSAFVTDNLEQFFSLYYQLSGLCVCVCVK